MTFDLDMNDDISITIDRIVMYLISNKMTRCQLNSKIDRMSIVSCVYKWQDVIDGLSKIKLYILRLECTFRKMGPFLNVDFKQKVINKWPCVAYHKKVDITKKGPCGWPCNNQYSRGNLSQSQISLWSALLNYWRDFL